MRRAMLQFEKTPSLWSLYPRILAGRKSARLKADASVPRIEGVLRNVRIDGAHLATYRSLCGWKGEGVPTTYPHVLASGLHLAMLASREFPVRLLGLVHVANRIEQSATLPDNGELFAWLEDHRETERGQEFDLHTEWRNGSNVPWRETMTFLARGKSAGGNKSRTKEVRPAADSSTSFDAPANIGRRYGPLAGDVNPIHMTNFTAKLFGFKRAIAHGMWSLARCAAEFPAQGPGTLDVQFKLPVFLPAKLVLERRGDDFTLLDEAREKPHLAGRYTRA
jgi:hypothetical protein